MTTTDPRTLGFNYGAPVRVNWAHWDQVNDAADYLRASPEPAFNSFRVSRAERTRKRLSWTLDMAIRDVRHACSEIEQQHAIRRLSNLLDITS